MTMETTMTEDDLESLSEIKEQIAELVAQARRLLRGTTEYERADAYWLAHIEGALDGHGSIVTMQDTIDALTAPEGDGGN